MKKRISDKGVYTDDNWLTFSHDCENTQEYEEEKNKNTIKEINLRILFGEFKVKLILEEYEKINDLLTKKDPSWKRQINGYGYEFEIFSVAIKHNLDYSTIINDHLVVGSNDGKVDVIYWDEPNVYIYQIKAGVANIDLKEIMEKRIDEYIDNGNISDDNCSDLKEFLDKNIDNFRNFDIHYEVIATNTGENENDSSKIYNDFFLQQIQPSDNANIKLKIPVDKRKVKNGKPVHNISMVDEAIFLLPIAASKFKRL